MSRTPLSESGRSGSNAANSGSRAVCAASLLRHQFECLVAGRFPDQGPDENLCDLPSRNDAILGCPGAAPVALQEDQMMLIRFVEVEPRGTHDRVGQPTGADQPFRTALSAVHSGGQIVQNVVIGHTDGRDQRDAPFVTGMGKNVP